MNQGGTPAAAARTVQVRMKLRREIWKGLLFINRWMG